MSRRVVSAKWSNQKIMKKSFLISGVSGVGKTTIAYEVLKRNPDIEKVITSTTREMRSSEENAKDYYFYSKQEFEEMLENGEFFEHAEVYGNLYGSEKKEVNRILNSTHTPLFVCDVHGIENLSKVVDNLVTIFIIPDSIENLRRRMEHRDGQISDSTEERLKQVDAEMKKADICDYRVLNSQGELEKAVEDVLSIIERELNTKPS